MKRSKMFATGYLSLETGSEGPRHDPYSYEEYSIYRNGQAATLHVGLAEWIEVNNQRLNSSGGVTLASLTEHFEKLCGISLKTFERVIHRSLPCCNNPKPHEERGYPGERITVCGSCGKHIDYSFNVNAVI